MKKYKVLKDCMDRKAGEIAEVRPEMASFLMERGYIEEVVEKKKKEE